ncbi:hypothetical protein NC651_033225 [Populus alba x Populus x berolinensis]|nr:hypothetical protein NC651_033225 [Populus alba x Populus x berolinensis]
MILNLNKKTARGSQDDTKQTIKPSASALVRSCSIVFAATNHSLDSDRPKMMLLSVEHTPLRFIAHVNTIITRASKIKCHVVFISLVMMAFLVMIIAAKLYLALLIDSENSRHRLGLGFFFIEFDNILLRTNHCNMVGILVIRLELMGKKFVTRG